MVAGKEARKSPAVRPEVPSPRPRSRAWAALLGTAVLLGGAVLGGVMLWQHFGSQATSGPEFQLSLDQIQIPTQPKWIRSDVRESVLRDGALGDLQIRDPQLAVRVAQAFELNPWVAEVTRVTKKYPAALIVELHYRQPVAMVEVRLNNQPGLLPVDSLGTLLPPEEFAAGDARDYLRIAAGETSPAGPVGTRWGDDRISGAAALAALLSDAWRPMGIHRIIVSQVLPGERQPPEYDLATRGNILVRWGRAPGKERSGETTAADKLARLTRLCGQDGSLESLGQKEIDVRSQSDAFPARTARRPVPTQ